MKSLCVFIHPMLFLLLLPHVEHGIDSSWLSKKPAIALQTFVFNSSGIVGKTGGRESNPHYLIGNQTWLKNPVNGFWYSLRSLKDIFSTLVQGTASYVFDMWLKNILEKRKQLTAQFHDEFILCLKEGYEEQCRKLVRWSMNKLNEDLKLNRELDCSIQFNKYYSEIH